MKRSTTRTDSNGIEIFEGDIITTYHFTDAEGKDRYIEHKVVWSHKYAAWWCINLENEALYGLEEEHTGDTFLYVLLKQPVPNSVKGPLGVVKAMNKQEVNNKE